MGILIFFCDVVRPHRGCASHIFPSGGSSFSSPRKVAAVILRTQVGFGNIAYCSQLGLNAKELLNSSEYGVWRAPSVNDAFMEGGISNNDAATPSEPADSLWDQDTCAENILTQ